MSYAHYIKEIGRGPQGAHDLSRLEATQIYAAMLDGGVPDLELGALVMALRLKGEGLDEMLGFMDALDDRTVRLELPPGRVRPVVLPSYNGTHTEANLTPLLALLLQRFGVPVLVHGLMEGLGRVTTAHLFRELGVMPSATSDQVQLALDRRGLAFAPLNALSPGILNLLALRARMGVRNTGHSLVKMLDPFHGDGILIAAASHPNLIELMRDMLLARAGRAILLRSTEGEPFANPRRRPRLEYVHEGKSALLFEAEHDSSRGIQHLPDIVDAVSTAGWIRKVLNRQLPIPKPIANQLACCLYVSGYAEDLNQAKAIVAVEAASPAALAA
ncbi:MAG: DNA-binding protein YbiB [Rhodocyclaceae bacterium]|nr:DNA-binding protein YbiB [Rhodocyclaceae bacterium]